MSTLDDATGHLQAVLSALTQAQTAAQDAAEDVGSAAEQLDAVGYSGGAQAAAAITGDLQSLTGAVAALREIAARLLARIISLAHGPATPSTAVTPSPSPVAAAAGPAAAAEPIPTPSPQLLTRLAADLALLRGQEKVAGIAATTADGTGLHLGVIGNGSAHQRVDSRRTLRTDLRPWNRRGNVGETHVEGHVAAIVREQFAATGEPVHVTLLIDRPPCPGPDGCHDRLRDMLPPGSSVTVYLPPRSGGHPTYHDTYIGNGSGVRSEG